MRRLNRDVFSGPSDNYVLLEFPDGKKHVLTGSTSHSSFLELARGFTAPDAKWLMKTYWNSRTRGWKTRIVSREELDRLIVGEKLKEIADES